MAFCENCGTEIISGAKFCHNCGCAISTTASTAGDQRKQQYSGKLYKCPSCGEVLKSFMTNCPSCGLELREVKPSSAVKEFALKLEAIESKREREGIFSRIRANQRVSKTDAQKISLIQSFSIPNTKEDILEFMILATANINMTALAAMDKNEREIALADAWLTKVKQAYSKAHESYGSNEDLLQIERLYKDCLRDINRQKKKHILKNVLVITTPFIFLLLFAGLIAIDSNISDQKEVKRLNNVVQQIQMALENEEYKIALMHAESIEYDGDDSEHERQWSINREYWIDKVIDEAENHGTHIERTPIETTDDVEPEKSDSGKGFIDGCWAELQPGQNTARKNINELIRV